MATTNKEESSCSKDELFSLLPPIYEKSLMSTIHDRVIDDSKNDNRVIVVLDDDPTGTQTVYDVPVLTGCSESEIENEFIVGTPAFYILTNSRSLPHNDAKALQVTIAQTLQKAAAKHNKTLEVISRSDSTLRGHYPLEIDVLINELNSTSNNNSDSSTNENIDGHFVIPFFLEGGRYTVNDVHYVKEGIDILTPAALTPFAKDKVFGFSKSNLKDYVIEKYSNSTKSITNRNDVLSISINELRQEDGPSIIRQKLRDNVNNGRVCIVNATCLRDMEVFVMGLLDCEKQDKKHFLVRSAASYVQVRLGLPSRPILDKTQIVTSTDTGVGGLVVIGSYVPKSSKQLEHLLAVDGLKRIEIDVAAIINESEGNRSKLLSTIKQDVESSLISGCNTVVYTSRKLITGSNDEENLNIGNTVSTCLVSIVSSLQTRPSFIIAKGGITSSDIATKGLGIKRAMVLGAALPGCPVWKIGDEGKFPGMSYIIFPGNVGNDDSISNLVMKLSDTTESNKKQKTI